MVDCTETVIKERVLEGEKLLQTNSKIAAKAQIDRVVINTKDPYLEKLVAFFQMRRKRRR